MRRFQGAFVALGCLGTLLVADSFVTGHAVEAASSPRTWLAEKGVERAGASVLADLRCGACHAGVPSPEPTRGMGPVLSSAGTRYNSGFLFAYLKNPTRVRPGIGRSRMPDFQFSDGEALAVVRYLESQQKKADSKAPSPSFRLPWRRVDRAAVERIIGERKCTSCHALNGKGGTLAPDLAQSGARLSRQWLWKFIAAPHVYEPSTVMPALLFDERDGHELVPEASSTLTQIVDYLVDISAARRDSLAGVHQTSARNNDKATRSLGEAIVRGQNCAGCHVLDGVLGAASGPSLEHESARVQSQWLREYLAHPVPIRLHGTRPGSGSRMPDYRLTEGERDSITAFLGDSLTSRSEAAATLSAFATHKAGLLLRDQLSCLGCHRIGSDGGEIGPNLSNSAVRLRPAFVAAMIRDPGHASPGSFMPRIPMRESDATLVAGYIARLSLGTDSLPMRYPSLLAHSPVPATGGVAGTYATRCAPCHGVTGNGDGFNASRLPVAPLAHSSRALMGPRTDDRLYDGIAAGGRVLGDSPRMPAFGETLSSAEIAALVRYLRTLCACEGPAWGRDGVPRVGGAK